MAFCTSCGRGLTVAPAPMSPNLPGPEEERRSVSVLAIDLVGFSSAAQTLDPEDLQLTQREFFDLVADPRGTVLVIDEAGSAPGATHHADQQPDVHRGDKPRHGQHDPALVPR